MNIAGTSKKLFGFGSATLLSAIVNFVAIPVLIRHAGAHTWAGVAVAQSVAGFASVIVSFGWGAFGAAWIAAMNREVRGTYFVGSLSSRMWLLALMLPIALVVVNYTATGNLAANMIACAAAMVPALGATWFFIGEVRPGLLIAFDAVPRLAGTIAGASLVAGGASIVAFSTCQLVGALIGVFLSAASILRRYSVGQLIWTPSAAVRRLRGQYGGVVTAGTASLYVSLPLVWVSSTVPGMAPIYALSDKLLKAAVSAQATVTQVAQGYVPAAGRAQLETRIRRTLKASSYASVFAGLGLAAVLAPVGAFLSGGELVPSFVVASGLGAALAAIGLSGVIGTACLPALGATRVTATSTVVGALVGVPLIVILTALYGINGTAWAVAFSEMVVSAYQLLHLRRRLDSIQDDGSQVRSE